MLESLKSILIQIQNDRKDELLKSVPDYQDKKERERGSLALFLEPPFSIKQFDRMVTYEKCANEDREKIQNKRHKTAYRIIQEWIYTGSNGIAQVREEFCRYLNSHGLLEFHHYFESSSYIPTPITAEELSERFHAYSVTEWINESRLEDTLKKTYLDMTAELEAHIKKDLYITPIQIFKKAQPLTLAELAHLFECLEKRALRSTTVRAFTDILIARALVYAPLPAKKLFSLPPPTKSPQGWVLTCDNKPFSVPYSFVKLSQALSSPTRLLPKVLSEDLLSKKIRNLGRYAEISTTLNPSILRLSLESLMTDLKLNSRAADLLPRR